MKSSTMRIDKDYMDFANMSPAELTKWLHDLVIGLKQKSRENTSHNKKTPHIH